MTSLPAPLAYDYVDKLIDLTTRFEKELITKAGRDYWIHLAYPRDRGFPSNFVREFFSLENDVPEGYDEDEEWFGGYPSFPSQAPSEPDLDFWVENGYLP